MADRMKMGTANVNAFIRSPNLSMRNGLQSDKFIIWQSCHARIQNVLPELFFLS